jgi:arylsulfatase A-like enzyme
MKALVVVAHRLHLGYVGCYGSDWVETPALDRLAAEGVVFDQHYADRPDAAGARHAWRTGCYAFPVLESDEQPPGYIPDLIRPFRDRGVITGLVIDPRCDIPADFRAGWHHVLRPNVLASADTLEATLNAVGAALDRLAAADDWLLWVELGTLLPPWRVPEEYLRQYFPTGEGSEARTPLANLPIGPWDGTDDTLLRLQDSYSAAVTYLDAGIEHLLAELSERGLLDDMLLLVTTDRGLSLGEHGIIGDHRPWLHDELIHLPLLVRLPGAAEAGRRVFALTQPVDLLPTLLDAFSLPLPPIHGHSLVPLLDGTAESVRVYACAGLMLGAAIEWALRTPEWAFVLPVQMEPGDAPRGPQLYRKPDDRWEVNNVIQHHLERAEGLEQILRGFIQATKQPGPLQPPELRID